MCLNYLLVGLGSIGKRHLKNLRSIEPDSHITVWHTSPKRNESEDNITLADRVVYSLEEAIFPKPDAAFITSPASSHISLAEKLVRESIDLFIEKPISASLSGIDELLKVQKTKKTLIMVGYNLRFHHPLQILKKNIENGKIGKIICIQAEAGQYLPHWRPGTDYRNSASARSDLGGGVILELSHELDYSLWLLGEAISVTAQAARLSNLEIDVEDTADILLTFSQGAMGNIHLDMIQQPSSRNCKVVGTGGTITWDGLTDSVMLFSNQTGEWSVLHPPKKEDWNSMYIAEMEHFLSCIRSRKVPLITGEDGKRALMVALAALRSAKEQRSIAL